MSLYNPEGGVPASDAELRELYDAWCPWLIETGAYSVGNKDNPEHGVFGLEFPDSGGDLLVPDPIVVASHPPTHARRFKDVGTDLEMWCPEAAGLLGIRSHMLIQHRAAYFGAASLDVSVTPPTFELGEYAPPDCYVGILDPTVEGIKIRAYLIKRGRGTMKGERHDVSPAAETLKDERGMPPLMTSEECRALATVGGVCMYLAAPVIKRNTQSKE